MLKTIKIVNSVVVLISLLAVNMVQAVSNVWNVAGGGNWDTNTANWIGDFTTFADDGTRDVFFNNTSGGTITISPNMTPKSTTVSASSGTYIFNGGPMDGSGSLVKSGAGTLDIACSNSFSGGLTINGGVLYARNPSSWGTGTVTINGGQINTYGTTMSSVTQYVINASFDCYNTAANTYFGNAPVTLNTPISVVVANGWTVGGPITGPGGLNTFDITTTVWGGCTYNVTFSGNIMLRTNQTVNFGGWSTTVSGIISDGGKGYGLRKTGLGTMVLLGANTFSGDTTISGGDLQLVNNLALQNSAVNTASGAIYLSITSPTFGGFMGSNDLIAVFPLGYTNVTSLTLNPLACHTNNYFGTISDGVAGMKLIKTGAGAQILSGTNTYTGATIVSNGTLLVNGSIASTNVTVASGGTLGGTGLVGGAVTLLPGANAVLKHGSQMTITGSLTLNTNTVHLALPAGLQVGTYPLVTFNPSGSSGVFGQIPVIDSGTAFGTPQIVTGSNRVDLVVSGLGTVVVIR